MPDASLHQARWLHNRTFATTITDEFPDWIVTAMFYAAVHAVEMLLAHDRTRAHDSHTARNQTLKTVSRYREVWKHCRPLFDAARAARYEVAAVSWIPVGDVKSKLAAHLYGLEASITRLTDMSAAPAVLWQPSEK